MTGSDVKFWASSAQSGHEVKKTFPKTQMSES